MTVPTPSSEQQPFTPHELEQFDSDDKAAGSAIGKILTLFFLYTVIAMIGASAATLYWISRNAAQ